MIHDDFLTRIRKVQILSVLSGSGISAASGIPTFRGKNGLWKNYRAEELANYEAFIRNPQLVWEWYTWRKNVIKKVQPTYAHHALVRLENYFSDVFIITQNVDNLHTLAGSKKVIELHGNIMRSKCSQCHIPYVEEFDPLQKIPTCHHCGSLIRPDVVWFGESLHIVALQEAEKNITSSDMLLVVGTSGIVEPAASLPFLAKSSGVFVAEINPEPTPLSPYADYWIQISADQFFKILLDKLNR